MLAVPPRSGGWFIKHGDRHRNNGDVVFGWVGEKHESQWKMGDIFWLGDIFCWVDKYSHDRSVEKWCIYLHE